MKNPVLKVLAFGFAAALSASGANAQWKPTSDVEFVIPYGLGGGADLLFGGNCRRSSRENCFLSCKQDPGVRRKREQNQMVSLTICNVPRHITNCQTQMTR